MWLPLLASLSELIPQTLELCKNLLPATSSSGSAVSLHWQPILCSGGILMKGSCEVADDVLPL